MLRPYFLYHRELLGDLARLAYETVREMMAAAIEEVDARPGMVAVIQTFGCSASTRPSSPRHLDSTRTSTRLCSPSRPEFLSRLPASQDRISYLFPLTIPASSLRAPVR